jgi:hypothetical protein
MSIFTKYIARFELEADGIRTSAKFEAKTIENLLDAIKKEGLILRERCWRIEKYSWRHPFGERIFLQDLWFSGFLNKKLIRDEISLIYQF